MRVRPLTRCRCAEFTRDEADPAPVLGHLNQKEET